MFFWCSKNCPSSMSKDVRDVLKWVGYLFHNFCLGIASDKPNYHFPSLMSRSYQSLIVLGKLIIIQTISEPEILAD